MTEFKEGDELIVTAKGIVTAVDYDGETFVSVNGLSESIAFYPKDLEGSDVTIEVVEPPLPPLKTGDVVEHILSKNRFLLYAGHEDGSFDYVSLQPEATRQTGIHDFTAWRTKYAVVAENFGIDKVAA